MTSVIFHTLHTKVQAIGKAVRDKREYCDFAVENMKCSAVVFTCQHCEVRRAGNGEEGWGNIGCLHPILGHLIQVGGFNVLVIVPAEAVKRDEQ